MTMTQFPRAVTWAAAGDLRAYKTADESSSSTTLQNDDHLTVTVIAGVEYHYRFQVMVAAAGSLEGIKLAIGGTCSATSLKAEISIFDDVSNTMVGLDRVTALAAGVGAGLSIGNALGTIEGTIEVNAGGTFLLSWAQNGGIGASATTVQRGSSLLMERFD